MNHLLTIERQHWVAFYVGLEDVGSRFKSGNRLRIPVVDDVLVWYRFGNRQHYHEARDGIAHEERELAPPFQWSVFLVWFREMVTVGFK